MLECRKVAKGKKRLKKLDSGRDARVSKREIISTRKEEVCHTMDQNQ